MVSPILPDVIDGDNGIHLFGSDTYVIVEANWDEGTAIYEHIKLYNVVKESPNHTEGGNGSLS